MSDTLSVLTGSNWGLRVVKLGVFLRLAIVVPLLSATSLTAKPASPSANQVAFRDYGYLPSPSIYKGRTFKLSQDYPRTRPALEPEVKRILATDFTTDWRAYAARVLDYALSGNVHGGPVGNDFYLEDNKTRRWYHVPWQDYGPLGREGVHGLTAEGPVQPKVLAPSQSGKFQAFAVGFYNAPGGWSIGRVWADHNKPRPEILSREGFPVGTVVAKLLFTDAPVDQAPFLTNPVEWNAFVFATPWVPGIDKAPAPPHRMQQVRLIQMDFMVRDDRAKATGGWVFGTFVYNGAMAQSSPWRNLVPVGISWSNEPNVTSMKAGNPSPTATLTNPDLKKTIINDDARNLPPQHLGFGLRLSGPVDNTLSSCQSCHQTAEVPALSPILAFSAKGPDGKVLTVNDPGWMRWFRDLPLHTAFDARVLNTDDSLQMAGSIKNFDASQGNQARQTAAHMGGKAAAEIMGQRGALPPEAADSAKGSPQ